MARTAIPVTALAADAGTVPATTAVDPTNDHVVTPAGPTDRLLFHLKNTAGAGKTFTFKAGVNPPAFRKDLGDLIVSLAATTGEQFVVIESARFMQADGTLNLDVEAGATGNEAVYRLPTV